MSTHAQFLSALNAIFDETSCKLKLQHIQSYIVMLPRVLDWLPVQSLRPPSIQSKTSTNYGWRPGFQANTLNPSTSRS